MKPARPWLRPRLASVVAIALLGTSVSAQARLPADTEIRAYLNESCIVADEPYYAPQSEDGQIEKSFALPGVIVGKVAYALLNGVFKLTAQSLGDMSKHKDMYFVSAYDFDMYRAALEDSPEITLNGQLGCVTVVAATFEPADTDCTQRYEPRTLPAGVREGDNDLDAKLIREDGSVENVLRRANACVAGSARSVFESRIRLSDDQTAFRLESAGLWVNSLLSTNSKRAKRSLIYTVEISAPAQNGSPAGLAVASIPIGTVQAGLEISDELSARSDWIRVPPMSSAAYSAYQRDTAIHQDVYGEIMALERSLLRNQRLRDGLEKRLSGASEQAAQIVREEVEQLEVKILRMDALLDARRAEYRDLPRTNRYYMPVVIEVGVIESRSEKRALGTLAGFLDEYSTTLAAKATQSAGFERSLDSLDDAGGDSALSTARSAYFDALVALQETESGNPEDSAAAEEALLRAKDAYNQARNAASIPEID